MKIRAITVGTSLVDHRDRSSLPEAAAFGWRARDTMVEGGFEVEDVRVTTQPWPDYLDGLDREGVLAAVDRIETACADLDIPFISLGAVSGGHIDMIPDIVSRTERVSVAAVVASPWGIDHRSVRAAAEVVLGVARGTEQGCGNFRFGAVACCPPDVPFFPGSYHEGEPCFMIALECGDLVNEALRRAGESDAGAGTEVLERAAAELATAYEGAVGPIEGIALEIEAREVVRFHGIDVSTAPPLNPGGSIAHAFEHLGVGRFGSPGTLAIAGMVTSVLRSLRLRTCGYSGLMLPLMEDAGLVARLEEGAFGVDDLLLLSAVCGTGLDTVPLPGDVPVEKVAAILLDVATLAVKLDKPLSARLLPVPGKGAGDRTDFGSPYLIDCIIPEIT